MVTSQDSHEHVPVYTSSSALDTLSQIEQYGLPVGVYETRRDPLILAVN